MTGQRRDDTAVGALLRFWPMLVAVGAAIAAGAVGIQRANDAHDAIATEREASLVRDRAQWERIAEANVTITQMRERLASLEAHH